LLHDQHLGLGEVAAFFIVLGVASVLATLFFWGRVIPRLARGYAPSIISLVVVIGVLPVLLSDGLAGAIVSAVVFGSSFMAGPTAATVLARRMLPAHGWTSGIALLTVAFSVGQAIGPLLAGLLSDTNGGIKLGLWLSVGLLGLAGLVALTQRDVVAAATEHPAVPIAPDSEGHASSRPRPQTPSYKRILAAIDSTDQRDRVLAATAELATLTGARVHVLHVDADATALDTDNETEPARAGSQLVARAVAELRLRGVAADGGVGHAADADIDDTVLYSARRLDADLIVIGANRRHGLAAWFEHSAANDIVRHASAAVLLVP
jgi:nucleotide-binding universal stress UspA family protein